MRRSCALVARVSFFVVVGAGVPPGGAFVCAVADIRREVIRRSSTNRREPQFLEANDAFDVDHQDDGDGRRDGDREVHSSMNEREADDREDDGRDDEDSRCEVAHPSGEPCEAAPHRRNVDPRIPGTAVDAVEHGRRGRGDGAENDRVDEGDEPVDRHDTRNDAL